MLHLGNDELRMTLLDPVADVSRLGERYVSGCYAYQIDDVRLGPLFSGPVYPKDPPPVFDGQGIPEAFSLITDPVSGQGVIPGNSIIATGGERRQREVLERCSWQVDQTQVQLHMSTRQQLGDISLELYREIALVGRQITSSTRVRNSGSVPLPLTWFAHPFFPWPEDGVCCRFSCDVSVAENPGFRVDGEGFIERLPEHDWGKGQFIQIDGVRGHQIEAVMRHPKCGEMTVLGDFAMSKMPIWGNACTVSFEPYLERTLAPDTELSWSLVYNV